MTPTQQKVYEYIRRYIAEHKHSPSYQQIADGVGIKAKSRICVVVRELVKDGYLKTHGDRRFHAIELVDDERDKLIEEMYEALKEAQNWNWMDGGEGVPCDVITKIGKVEFDAQKHIRRKALSDMAERDADLILKGY